MRSADQLLTADEVAEWLRRWTANPMCSARVGSNPILVDIFCGGYSAGCLVLGCAVQNAWKTKLQGSQKEFRYRELNPGHLGESQVS
jgi:hypothetical protein